ncbi:MAG: hypothetical protein ACP5N9_02635 [Candidatus Bilamarchaeum sp.]|jgi:predicted transcriptional regulator
MIEIFMRPKPCKMMRLLRDTDSSWHLSKLAKNSDCTYVYIKELVGKLEAAGYMFSEQKGKKRIIKLTEKGMKVANIIEELNQKIETK